MEKEQEAFQYTYSAQQQKEIKKIQEKYLPQEENKMEQLRKLDKSVEKPGTIWSILCGSVGTLLFGIGMTCTMVWTTYFVFGIIIGVMGIMLIIVAYPIYSYRTKKQREKMAPEIIKLSEELMEHIH